MCVNPGHLFLGTPAENVADMIRKGRVKTGKESWSANHMDRMARGERHGMSKLSPEQVLEIKSLLREGVSGEELARRYGVVPTTISEIKHGNTWKHLG